MCMEDETYLNLPKDDETDAVDNFEITLLHLKKNIIYTHVSTKVYPNMTAFIFTLTKIWDAQFSFTVYTRG